MTKKYFNLNTLPDISTKAVTCTVTGEKVGDNDAWVCAHNYDRHRNTNRKYRVPLYRMVLSVKGVPTEPSFEVIRWCVVADKTEDGQVYDYLYVFPAGEYDLVWQEQYLDDTGGWRLVGTRGRKNRGKKRRTNALIHDGSDYPTRKGHAWGAAGCIEVTGLIDDRDAWQVFNQRVRELSGTPDDWERIRAHKLIQKKQSFKCVLKPVARPPFKSKVPKARPRGRRGGRARQGRPRIGSTL